AQAGRVRAADRRADRRDLFSRRTYRAREPNSPQWRAPVADRRRTCRSAKPRLEIFIAETADFLQLVALAVPQPDRRQRDAVEAVGLDHRIMRLVEEGETLADVDVTGQAVIADDIAGEAGGAAEAGDRAARL